MPSWSTKLAPGQPGLHRKTLSQQTNKATKTKIKLKERERIRESQDLQASVSGEGFLSKVKKECNGPSRNDQRPLCLSVYQAIQTMDCKEKAISPEISCLRRERQQRGKLVPSNKISHSSNNSSDHLQEETEGLMVGATTP